MFSYFLFQNLSKSERDLGFCKADSSNFDMGRASSMQDVSGQHLQTPPFLRRSISSKDRNGHVRFSMDQSTLRKPFEEVILHLQDLFTYMHYSQTQHVGFLQDSVFQEEPSLSVASGSMNQVKSPTSHRCTPHYKCPNS